MKTFTSLEAVALICLALCSQYSLAIRWLGIRHDSDHKWQKQDCKRIHGLDGKQFSMCRRNLPIMPYVTESVEMTRAECQAQFQNRRWNCTTILRAPKYLSDLKRGTAEASYVYSLSSAALTYTVTQACSTGRLEMCTCGKIPKLTLQKKNWEWGGCSDNIAYGERFSKRFTDTIEVKRLKKSGKNSIAMALMNMHNNDVGRKAVRSLLEIICKCHGVSGGCQTKTCFRRLSEFKPIASLLKKRYRRVVYVVSSKVKSNRKKRILKAKNSRRRYSTRDLIALTSSPNYCKKNKKSSLGTRGRECDPKKRRSEGGCGYMCCGRGQYTDNMVVTERCNCQYIWCCYVKCDKCTKAVSVTRCY